VVHATATEGEERGILEREEGEAGHQGIGQGKRRGAPWLGEGLETLPGTVDQGVKVEMAALAALGSCLAHGSPFRRVGAITR
jgi:hypothetical protein